MTDDQATMKDVAEAAGVSIATVSNVIKGSRSVSLSTMQLVQNAIRKTGYRFPQAISIKHQNKGRRTRHIGLVLPSVVDSHYAEIYTGVDQFLSESGFTVSLSLSSEIQAKEQRIIEQLVKQKVEGVLIATCQPASTSMFRSVIDNGMPLVFIEREVVGCDLPFIGLDLEKGFAQTVRHSLQAGKANPLLLIGPVDSTCEKACRDGFLQALGDDFDNPGARVVETNLNKESAFSSLIPYLHGERVPDVIFVSSRQLLLGARMAVQTLALEPSPSFVCLTPASWINLDIDTVSWLRLPSRHLGETAAKMLLSRIEGDAGREAGRTLLPVHFPDNSADAAPSVRKRGASSIRVLMLMSPYSQSIKAMLPAFTKRSGIAVEIVEKTILELGAIMRSPELRAGFDVFQIDQPWLGEMASDGLLRELDDWMGENNHLLEGWLPGVLEAYCRHRGHYYTIPSIFGAQLLFYRKDLFDEPSIRSNFRKRWHYDIRAPRTWEEFNRIAEFFTRRINPESPVQYGTTLGAQKPNGALCEYLPRLLAYSKCQFSAQSMLQSLGSPEAEAALTNYVQSFAYAPPEACDFSWEEQMQVFSQGQAAMMILFTGHVAGLTNRKVSKVVGRGGFAMVPGGTPMLGGWTLGVSSRSSFPEEAQEFIAWTCRDDTLIPFTLLGGTQPSRKVYDNSELFSLYPWWPKAVEALSKSYWRNISKVTTAGKVEERVFEDIVGEAVHRAVIAEQAPAQALRSAREMLEGLLKSESPAISL